MRQVYREDMRDETLRDTVFDRFFRLPHRFLFSSRPNPKSIPLAKSRTASKRISDWWSMTTSPAPNLNDLNERSLLHLYMAAYTLLPVSQPLSSHLGRHLLRTAFDHDVNLPESLTDTRLCSRCGTLYLPGVTCTVQTVQSRRQKRTAKQSTWVIYDCGVCKKSFRLEATDPKGTPNKISQPLLSQPDDKELKAAERTDVKNKTGRRRKRDRLHGLRNAIEKSVAEKLVTQLDLQDLMKVD